ncbi:peptidoglycan-binding protein [Bacillus thuringiensis]|uniref:peptidoglycan-binding protein n=1 Tax=Bacillus thuringiensis TaxID=1428 RepID=UPI000B448AFD|nr:peptidoglycan-binding protein [Bacillus thuringiensis]MED3181213.1 peptidoglycan-binding protein [Bacillus thuringiensis]OTY05493.1 peptidoglycan-binding protein [Bacillus thuringiensis serovar kim]OUB13798.1 peptidoglycan-binding protein [Bacillus thuringiensis serovar xiaguangiensis]
MNTEYNVSERQTTGTLNVSSFLREEPKPGAGETSFLGDQGKPVPGAKVSIRDINGNLLTTLLTDESGQTKNVKLPAPKKSLSLAPVDVIPYAKYNVTVEAPGYVTSEIKGVQIFADTESTQPVPLTDIRQTNNRQPQEITISDHALLGKVPKLLEEQINKEIKSLPPAPLPPAPLPTEYALIMLPETIVPEYIIVHDGHPNNNSASKYKVSFKAYITNVACSEIYPTWPIESIKANVTCIVSFTLNRIMTEFYKGKGKKFTITSSTAFDHKWIRERTIYQTISNVVDNILARYISFFEYPPHFPFLAQYCDGKRVKCQKWLSQWGSKYLADAGKTDLEILKNYYGSTVKLFTANQAQGLPESFPGYNLQVGSKGDVVKDMQTYLNSISNNYPAIEKLQADGLFGPATQKAIKKFQAIFRLPQTGIVDYITWYKISDIYVAVNKFAEGRELQHTSSPFRNFHSLNEGDTYSPYVTWVPIIKY